MSRSLPAVSVLALALAALLPAPPAAAQPAFPDDSAIRVLLEARIAEGRTPGIVAGLLEGGETRFVSAGTSGRDGLALDGGTIFEIGSITKVFTGIALASLAADGTLAVDDPVRLHLPPGRRVPDFEGREITLRHLSTHTSGLPRVPDNLDAQTFADPYARYDAERLYTFLAGHTLRRAPGEAWEYSNLGAGLLGFVLASRAGTSYEALLLERILRPLGLRDTFVERTPERDARSAVGHNALGGPVPPWRFDALAGAGALRSTAAELLRFAAANLDADRAPVPGLSTVLQPHGEAPVAGGTMGLGWVLREVDGRRYAWHDGGTGGFRAFLALDLDGGRAVVVLGNGVGDVAEVGLRLLNPGTEPGP